MTSIGEGENRQKFSGLTLIYLFYFAASRDIILTLSYILCRRWGTTIRSREMSAAEARLLSLIVLEQFFGGTAWGHHAGDPVPPTGEPGGAIHPGRGSPACRGPGTAEEAPCSKHNGLVAGMEPHL